LPRIDGFGRRLRSLEACFCDTSFPERLSSRICFRMLPTRARSTLFPYTTLFRSRKGVFSSIGRAATLATVAAVALTAVEPTMARSEEHTSELQSRENLVCRLLLEKKKENRFVGRAVQDVVQLEYCNGTQSN